MLFRFWVFPDCTFLDISTLHVNRRALLLAILALHSKYVDEVT